jgi:hypothetical protein
MQESKIDYDQEIVTPNATVESESSSDPEDFFSVVENTLLYESVDCVGY